MLDERERKGSVGLVGGETRIMIITVKLLANNGYFLLL